MGMLFVNEQIIPNVLNRFKNYDPVLGKDSNRFCPDGDQWLFGYFPLFGPRKDGFNYDTNFCSKVIAISGSRWDNETTYPETIDGKFICGSRDKRSSYC